MIEVDATCLVNHMGVWASQPRDRSSVQEVHSLRSGNLGAAMAAAPATPKPEREEPAQRAVAPLSDSD